MNRLLLLFLLLAAPAHAKVERILSGREIELSEAPSCAPRTRVAIFSQGGEQEALGYAEITGTSGVKNFCKATVLTHTRSALVRAGDRTEALNLRSRDVKVPGRYDLVLENERKVAARFKPLVYAGYVFGETASTLAKGEFMLGFFPLFYGITDRAQVGTFPLLAADKTLALSGKYKFFDGEDVTFALLGRVNQHYDIGKRSWTATLFYDSTSNSSSMSHTTVTFNSKLPTGAIFTARNKEKRFSTELTSTYEWVLRGWQRVLLGPKFTAGETKDLGFVATVVFPYDYFHWAINVKLESITRLEFRDKKQLIGADFFWRL